MNFKSVEVDTPEPLSDAAQAWVEARRVAHAAGESGTTEPSGLSNDDLHALHAKLVYNMDFGLVADLMHPTDAEYLDPIYGAFKGQANIRAWITEVMGKVGNITFEPLMKPVWNGSTSLQKWRQVAELSDGTMAEMAWGYSIHRFKDGWLVYTADYVDTAGLARPEVESVSEQIGAEISHEEMMREGKPSSTE
jgi:hypothetical protein